MHDGVSVTGCFAIKFSLHRETFQAERCLLHNAALFAVAHRLFLHLELAIQEHFLLFVLDYERWLRNGIAIVGLIVLLLVALLIRCLCVGLAVKDHLLPGLKPLENVEHIFVLRIMSLRWAHERAMLQAIVFELALVFLSDTEGL